MQYKVPEILYFLFLLIIPVLIHLFQLQKFKKEAFTNVKFLKEVELETRKSSKLKKLLILLSRLMLLACLIIAFAQPYIKKETGTTIHERIIYLDNSMSMQAKAKSGGDLLQINKNLLLNGLKENDLEYSLITNESTAEKLNYKLFKKALLGVNFNPVARDINQIILGAEAINKETDKILGDIYLISDFQEINNAINPALLDENKQYYLINSHINKVENISIDTAWIAENDGKNLMIRSKVRSHQMNVKDLSISLFLGNELYAKTTLSLKPDETKEVEFSIPSEKTVEGRISLTDHRLTFDNNIFFKIPKRIKTKVLVIGDNSNYLRRIYQKEIFDLKLLNLQNLEQNLIAEQDLIILNELVKISNPLAQSLKSFVQNKGNLVIIPAANSDLFSYNNLLNSLQLGKVIQAIDDEKRINTINYDHPFFKGVFKEHVLNFQYPKVQQYFETELVNAAPLLLFENQAAFISEITYFEHKIYWIASPLSKDESDFIKSPLIVPVFYNFSPQNENTGSLYMIIGQKNEITLSSELFSEEALKIGNESSDFIPQQSRRKGRVKIITEEYPLVAGIYKIKNKDTDFEKLAYNYDRLESKLVFNKISDLGSTYPNVHFFSSVDKAIQDLNDRNNNKSLWQLFIIFALVFLILEILLQKFLKN